MAFDPAYTCWLCGSALDGNGWCDACDGQERPGWLESDPLDVDEQFVDELDAGDIEDRSI